MGGYGFLDNSEGDLAFSSLSKMCLKLILTQLHLQIPNFQMIPLESEVSLNRFMFLAPVSQLDGAIWRGLWSCND